MFFARQKLLRHRRAMLAAALALCAAAGLCAGGTNAADSLQMAVGPPPSVFYPGIMPGPGPNLIDSATSASYHFGLGDSVGVYYTFKPQPPKATQKILPHDTLVAYYHFDTTTDAAYKVQPQDVLLLYFRYSPPSNQPTDSPVLSRAYIVQPDGNILLVGINKLLSVRDKTVGEIRKLIEEAYQPLLHDPGVAVSVEAKFSREGTLSAVVDKGFITAVVPEDGKLSLPLIPELPAAGRTVQQVGSELTKRYHDLGYKLLTVTVRYDSIADERHAQLRELLKGTPYFGLDINQTGRIALPMCEGFAIVGKTPAQVSHELSDFYHNLGLERVQVDVNVILPRSRVFRIMGAVEKPGVYAYHGQSDLWGAVATAGGMAPDADTAQVRIVPGRGGRARGPFSFGEFLKENTPQDNPLLAGDETIYVPRKGE